MEAENRNPWMGLSSYQDPQTSDYPLLFCGRGNESFDVSQLVENNIFVTLYGKSGTGKTSLLNAGVFPILRKDHFLPVNIRLGLEAIGTSFQHCIIERIQQAVEKCSGTIHTVNVIPLADAEDKEEYLWSHFARTRYEDNNGSLVYPVIVLDQFEEVFRNRRKDAEVLLRQIYFLMNETHVLSDRIVDNIPYIYDFNFRFVATIREDDLFRLEDSIDNNFLPEMKRCRFRLRNLSEDGAREVVLVPAGNLFKESERDIIADKIINIARDSEGNTISSNILSLVCSRIFSEHLKEGSSEITLPLVDKFIKGNPFDRFYKEATQGLSNREKSYIETHLVDSSGRRNSIPENELQRHVKNSEKLFDGDLKILQRVSTSSSIGDTRVELIHDSFCEPLATLKVKREKWEKRKKVLTRTAFFVLGLFVLLLAAGLLNERRNSLNRAIEQRISNLEETDYGIVTIDEIQYSTASPTNQQIAEWIDTYSTVCRNKLEALDIEQFSIRDDMLNYHPCLVYLILTSRSISSVTDKQEWLDMYPLMNQDQIDKLYDILYRERYKLAQLRSSSSAEFYNDKAYQYRNSGDLDSALITIDKGIQLVTFQLANLYDSKGQFILEQGNEDEALEMWTMVMELEPDFIHKLKQGTTHLYEGLLERNLIK